MHLRLGGEDTDESVITAACIISFSGIVMPNAAKMTFLDLFVIFFVYPMCTNYDYKFGYFLKSTKFKFSKKEKPVALSL